MAKLNSFFVYGFPGFKVQKKRSLWYINFWLALQKQNSFFNWRKKSQFSFKFEHKYAPF